MNYGLKMEELDDKHEEDSDFLQSHLTVIDVCKNTD